MLTGHALLATWIGAAFSLLLALNFAYAIWRARFQVATGKYWSRTRGQILRSQALPSLPGSEEQSFGLDIRYRYRVCEKDYEGDRLRLGGIGRTSGLIADTIAARYPAGAQVTVYYDPKNPKNAVLEPKANGHVGVLIVFLVVSCVAALTLIAHLIAGKVITAPNGAPLVAFCLPLAAIAVAIGGFVDFVRQRRRARASLTWPTVIGEITDIAIVQEVSGKGGRTRRKYRPDIRYAYRVGAREHHSATWKWGWAFLYSDPDHARKVIAHYAVGQSVPVYYNPAQPGESVLEPSNRQGGASSLLFGAIFGIGGLLFFWAFATIPMT